MKKIISIAISLFSITAIAQETYESAQIATTDLNGTARYVGMGGAMEALGADISTISTNPAGIGLFRRSWIGISAGATIQKGNSSPVQILDKSGVTNADLNQIGAVYAMQMNEKSFLNLGFNFHKSRNFNQILSAYSEYNENIGTSLSKSTALMGYDYTNDDIHIPITHQLVFDTFNNQIPRTENESEPNNYNRMSGYPYANSDKYLAQREISGYIGSYDFNISGNINNKVFLGLTFGVKSVHYNSDSYYTENLLSANYLEPNYYTASINGSGELGVRDNRKVTGSGFDLKFGAIFRPIEESPFRIGLYINTPTWYRLTCSSTMYGYGFGEYDAIKYKMVNNEPQIQSVSKVSFDSDNDRNISNTYTYNYDYGINTPWRFGVSLGHTFGNMVALGATYEFADYSSIRNKIKDGYYYNEYNDYYYNTYDNDKDMDKNTSFSLKGVHTLKIGAEIKPVPEVAIRLGYNYVSPIYEDNGYKALNMYSPGYEYCMADYTNWKGVNRVTFGLGFLLGKNVNLDLSYQYATQKGTYYPYCEYSLITDNASYSVVPPTVEVKNDRHQINCTLSYKF